MQQTSRCHHDTLVLALLILDKIREQILFHTPWLSSAHLPNCIQTGRNNFTANSGMHELRGNFPYDRCEFIRRREFMHRLRERCKNRWYLKLVVIEIFDDIGEKSKDTELVQTHSMTEYLHYEDFVIERVPFVILM